MMLLPSRGRRSMLMEFFEVSRPRLPGRVLIDEDDAPTYAGVVLPDGWDWFVAPRGPLVAIVNRFFAAYQNETWYGSVTDDLRFEAPGWDVILSSAAADRFVAWGDDGIKGAKNSASFFVGGKLVRHMGWLAHPAFGHLYADNVWWQIGAGASLARYRPDVKFRHLRIDDETFKTRSTVGDRERFALMKQNGELAALIARARLC